MIIVSLFFPVAKHSNLADVALAGLASKENFRKVSLRSVKSTDVVTNNSALPFNKLMLIRIKGQKHKRMCCVLDESSPRNIYNKQRQNTCTQHLCSEEAL